MLGKGFTAVDLHFEGISNKFKGALKRVSMVFLGSFHGFSKLAQASVFQAVRNCRQCGVVGGVKVPPATLCWYS